MDSILLSLAILSVFRSCVSNPIEETSCEDDVHLACSSKDFHDSLNGDSFSMLNEETLVMHCSDILEDIECKKNFLVTCDPAGAEPFSLATDGIKDVLGDLCNDTTDLRKAYHLHSPCISIVSADYEDCILNSANGAVDDYDDEGNDVASNDSMIRKMCRFYEPFKFCVTQATSKMCGSSAAQFVEQVIVRMAAPAINAKCSNSQ